MAQHDYVIDNSTGANVRADINSALQAIVTNNSGSSAPSATFPFMLFADSSAGTMKIRNAADNAFIELFQLDGTFTLEDGSASTPALAFRDDLNTGIFSGGADEFNIATGGNERFVINSSGNCGIGCGAPQQLLHVFPDILSTTSSFVRITAGNRAASTGLDLGHNSSGDCDVNAVSNANLIFSTNNTERLRITNTGNVGIGTASPAQPLHVLSTTEPAILARNSSGGTGIRMQSDSGSTCSLSFSDLDAHNQGLIMYDHSDDHMEFKTAGNTRMVINSSGNVGIGTTSPSGKLNLATGASTACELRLTSNNTGSGSGDRGRISVFSSRNDGTAFEAGKIEIDRESTTEDKARIQFFTNGGSGTTERMRIDSSGRVLVGTTTQYGRIHSDELNFNPSNSNWLTGASYVASGSFGGGYALLDGSKGYSMFCGDNGVDFFIQHHSSTTAGASGGVLLDNAATSWTSGSDERDKENLVDLTNGITKIKALRTVIGNYIWQPDVKHAFLIAQDVQNVLPEAVSVMNKDAKTEDQRLGIRYTEVMPLITKALQEAIGKIETLETKVAALEAA